MLNPRAVSDTRSGLLLPKLHPVETRLRHCIRSGSADFEISSEAGGAASPLQRSVRGLHGLNGSAKELRAAGVEGAMLRPAQVQFSEVLPVVRWKTFKPGLML